MGKRGQLIFVDDSGDPGFKFEKAASHTFVIACIILTTLDRFGNMRDASVYLDGKAGKNYRNRSVAKIRQKLNQNTRRMVSLKLEDSRDDVLIQMADMIAGSIRVKYDVAKVAKRDYFAVVKDKLEDLYFYSGT